MLAGVSARSDSKRRNGKRRGPRIKDRRKETEGEIRARRNVQARAPGSRNGTRSRGSPPVTPAGHATFREL